MLNINNNQRAGASWLFIMLIATVVMPWYKTPSIEHSAWVDSALVNANNGSTWLWLCVLTPLILSLTSLLNRQFNRIDTLAVSIVGLAFAIFQAFAIPLNGTELGLVQSVFPSSVNGQTGLGWGGYTFFVGCLGFLSHVLASFGLCKGDRFASAAIVFISALLITFVFFPISKLILTAFIQPDGSWGVAHALPRVTSNELWQLRCFTGSGRCGVVINSLILATLAASLSTIIGLALALLFVRSDFKYKKLLRGLSILPIITPPFVVGVALIVLFGRSGLITGFTADLFDVRPTRWLYGLPGILMAQVLAFTPVTFLVIQGALESINPTLEEASQTMGAKPLHSFYRVTLPLLKPGIAAAFLLAFIESLSDFGNPIVLGGNFEVLSTKIFFAVVGARYDLTNAAVLSIILLGLTLAAFWLQKRWLGEKSYVTVTGKSDAGVVAPLPKTLQNGAAGFVVPFILLTLAIYSIVLIGGVVKDIGRWDLTPSIEHLSTAFSFEISTSGIELYGSAWNSLKTTLWVAGIAAPITAVLGILTAWLITRQQFYGRRQFEFMTMLSFAVPGTVVGVSYVAAFNVPPVDMTGTLIILIICFAFRNMPVGMRAGVAALSQIDKSMEEASQTMGAGSFATLRNVVLPMIKPAIFTATIYAFVTAMTAVSAVIFLVSARHNMATAYIMGRVENGEYALAITYSAVLMVIMILVIGLIAIGVGKKRQFRQRNTEQNNNQLIEATQK
ncbi:iron ABC transporter permease [Vibrio lamellibrachiae]|uniref:ABC transporter permease n=1 Tax=Vibrio lamellibrachiae TaxID=2910253 RepID=UPI003D1395A7